MPGPTAARTERRRRRVRAGLRLALLAGLLGALPAPPSAWADGEAIETAALAPFGPWPPEADAPATVPQRAAVALGEQLFFSPRLGDGGGVRCASCHEPWRGFVDGRPRALGLALGARNTPTLRDVATHHHYGWDGARDELWRQALRPLDDPREMPAGAAHVAALVRDDGVLAARYALAFGAPPADDAQVRRDVGRALAAYVGTLTSARTPFDDWRDARLAGATSLALPAAAGRGFALFAGRAGCAACHGGATFGDDAPHVSLVRSRAPDGTPDDGRGGNAFRTPGLRGVATTGPWMHDGSVATLCEAVRPHALSGAAPALLADAERADVVAFLQALGDAPADPTPRRCPTP